MSELTTQQIVWQYFLVVLAYWWTLLPAIAMPTIDAWNWHLPEGKRLKVPLWLKLVISLICLMIAQFLAYRNSIANLSIAIEEKRQQAITINSLKGVTQDQDSQISALKQHVKGLEQTPPQRIVTKTSNQPASALPVVLPLVQPTTQLDRLIAINGRMTAADREQFATALHDFSQTLDQANSLWIKINPEGGRLNQEWQTGSIATDFESHKTTLLQISASAKDFAKIFPQVREKWKYYQEQVNYIFGDDPDNQGPNAIINAAEGYANYLDLWARIPNKGQKPVLNLLATEQREFETYLKKFSVWHQGSEFRLGQMRDSIR